jgi:protein-L-isoaspartate(D-aspartate) O-methyltransferase
MIQRQKGVPAWWNYDESTTESPPSHARMRDRRPVRRAKAIAWAALVLLFVGPAGMSIADEFRASERHKMVAEIVRLARIARETGRPVLGDRVLDAMRKVPRHEFVPGVQKRAAYRNRPLPIGEGQTISQPYVVARMCELLELRGDESVLDVGTGSGYHAAVLARLVARVISIERLASLSREAREALDAAGVRNVTLVVGDGSAGYEEEAPYDAINVAAGSAHGVPPALADQLAENGRIVIPSDAHGQRLVLVRRRDGGFEEQQHEFVRFVPLVSEPGAHPTGP